MLPDSPLTMIPLHRPLSWRWPIPGSKSLTNRALPLAALAQGKSRLRGVLHSDDTRYMRCCLQQLGINIQEDEQGDWWVQGGLQRLRPSAEPLQVGNSGTTVRFLSALAALVQGRTSFIGDADMAQRPIADLLTALRSLGVSVHCESGCPPLSVVGNGRLSGRASIPGTRSSQYSSALLLAGAADPQGIEVQIEGSLVSEPYVRMTCAMIRAFSGQAGGEAGRFFAHGPLRAADISIEADASAASYAFAAALACGGRVTVPNLGRGSVQGDLAFVEILAQMGAVVEQDEQSTTLIAGSGLQGVDVDMHHISDTVMTLAAIAPLAQGPTTIRNIANIRIKECDRLQALVENLRQLGQRVDHGEDWLRIHPASIRPATIACHRDHRIAMSFAILGLARSGISIADPACVAKTYPDFWLHLQQLSQDHAAEQVWVPCA